jgi:deoxyribonuclease-1
MQRKMRYFMGTTPAGILIGLFLSMNQAGGDDTPVTEEVQAEPLLPFVDLLPDTPSFGTARKRMYEKIYVGSEFTFYCDCPFETSNGGFNVAASECGMNQMQSPLAYKTEAEHVVPASVLGFSRPCWAEGGRSHCLKVDPIFKRAYSDLHNLVPAVGLINRKRSNYSWGYLDGEQREYGECDFEVDSENGMAEPRHEVRGDIARIYFYMEYMYGLPLLSEGERRLFHYWSKEDPVDKWEKKRDTRIRETQGNGNPFVCGEML